MNYRRIYDALMQRAKSRALTFDLYLEKHHIIPRCIGGADEDSNLVYLTAEEHYVAHQLLVKLYPDQPGLALAAQLMCFDRWGNRLSNKAFGWIRRKARQGNKGRVRSAETREKISKANKARGPVLTEEGRQKLVEAGKRRVVSEETREKLRIAKLGFRHSPEALAKMSAAHRGRPVSDETRKKLSESNKGKRTGILVGENTRRKLSEINKGRRHSEEVKAKIGEASRTRVRTQETRDKQSEAILALKGTPSGTERSRKISEALKGKPKSPEAIAKRQETRRRNRDLKKAAEAD